MENSFPNGGHYLPYSGHSRQIRIGILFSYQSARRLIRWNNPSSAGRVYRRGEEMAGLWVQLGRTGSPM
jgi:hypothetical protein